MGQMANRSVRRGDALVYALWIAGALGAAATMLQGWNNPIANRDFASFWVAGKLAAQGHAVQAYDLAALKAAATSLAGTSFNIVFPYPPHLLFIAVPLSFIPLTFSFLFWQAISALLFWVAARPYLPKEMPTFLAALTPAALINVAFGQIGLFIGALWLFAFSGSPIAMACLTMKPHVGFLVAIESARKRLLIATIFIAAALIGASALVFGLDAWRAFIAGAAVGQLGMIRAGSHPNWYAQMVTPLIGFGVVGWFIFAGAAVLLLVRRFDVFTAATATFLIAPYGFHYDLAVVCLGFGVLLFRSWRTMLPWHSCICALAFLAPVIVRAGTWFLPPILLAGLYVLTLYKTDTVGMDSVSAVGDPC